MSLTTADSNRVANLSFLCVLAVVLTHVKWQTVGGGWVEFGRFAHTVFRSILPFFFVTSGFFLARHAAEHDWWPHAVMQRVRSLLVPFLVWTALYAAEMFVLDLITNLANARPLLSNLRGVWGDIRLFFGLTPFAQPALAPLWYVRNLFILVLISPLLLGLLARLRTAWLATAAALYFAVAVLFDLGLLDTTHGAGAVFAYCFTTEGLLFFSVGLYLGRRDGVAPPVARGSRAWAVASALLGLALVYLAVFDGRFGYSLLESLSMPLIAFGVWRLCPSRAWPRVLVSTAFPIYIMHPVLFDIFYGLAPLLGVSTRSAPFGWALFVLTVVSSILLVTGVRTCGRGLAAILFGGR